MGRLWLWRQIKTHPVVTILVLALVLVILGGYLFHWDWAGFNGSIQVSIIHTLSGPTAGTVTRTEMYQPGKTLWDWLQLLIIPLALAIIAIFFNRSERKNEQRIALDNQQEAALQGYLNEISELILEKDLLKSDADAKVRIIARVRTLTVLPRLDAERKGRVLQFLKESSLISYNNRIVDLRYTDLSGANLIGLDLREAYLSEADLHGASLSRAYLDGASLSVANLIGADLSGAVLMSKADLSFTRLIGANLCEANLSNAILLGADLSEALLIEASLSGADLSEAYLTGADLSRANLTGAKVTKEQLDKAKSLTGATMPDGKINQ